MEKEFEIRKLLGNEYHLSISYEIDFDKPEWVLYRKYDDPKIYYSDNNEAIMSSETNTIDELYEFAKNHHKINEHYFMSILNVIVAWLAFGLAIINIFINSEILKGFLYGIDFIVIIYCLVSHLIYKKNQKVKKLEIIENFKYIK